MPRKKQHESLAKQSARFRSEVQRLIDAGELDPIEAEAAVDRLVRKTAARKSD